MLKVLTAPLLRPSPVWGLILLPSHEFLSQGVQFGLQLLLTVLAACFLDELAAHVVPALLS